MSGLTTSPTMPTIRVHPLPPAISVRNRAPSALPRGQKRSAAVWLTRATRSVSLVSPVLFFTLNREDFSFVIHLDRQPRTSRRREAQTGSRARSGSRSERTLDAVEHSRTLMEWWPFLIFHRGGLRIKVINNIRSRRLAR